MIKNRLQATATAALLVSASANATLEPRLGGKAYYDTESNLTWATPAAARSIKEQIAFVSDLIIDGIDGWRIPDRPEFFNFTNNYSDCSYPTGGGCPPYIPASPIDEYSWAWGVNWISHGSYNNTPDGYEDFAVTVYGITYGTYIPAYANGYMLDFVMLINDQDNARYTVWPVHTGDVALIPEPATYAMLLAGLGLLGLMTHKIRTDKAVSSST